VDYRVMEFSRYATRVEAPAGHEPAPTEKSLSTLALIRDPAAVNLGELLWRIGMPASALVLALLAIPLSFVNPRAGRSVNLVFALLAYMVYYNLLTVSQARVSQGRLDFAIGWWPVHAAMLLILLALFAHRQTLGGLRLRWRRTWR
jgi:lipopolysaccharide export system permease protein